MNGRKAKLLRKVATRGNLRYRKLKKVVTGNTGLYKIIKYEYENGQI